MKRFLKYCGVLILLYGFLCFITPFNKRLRDRSIKNQINYLSKLLDEGYDDVLQERFPEGKLFGNCLLALAVIEFCDKNEIENSNYADVVDNCIRRIDSAKAKENFDFNLRPELGMFYLGWSNLVYSDYKKSSLIEYSKVRNDVEKRSAEIESTLLTIQADSLRIIPSYQEANWPADNFIGISSVKNSDLKIKWIDLLFNTTRHPSGLIHHSGFDPYEIRGSSSAMITYCLKRAEYDGSEEYNELYKNRFVRTLMGMQLVLENENGSNDRDIDSGPVWFGYGASATIMNIKTQSLFGDSNAKVTWAVMNLMGLPIQIFKRKSYLFKREPMLDLFMLWTCTGF